jgi:hypothetical protein
LFFLVVIPEGDLLLSLHLGLAWGVRPTKNPLQKGASAPDLLHPT